MFTDLVMKNRSYRRFYQEAAIDDVTLRELVDLARHTASGMNLQPLKYVLSSNRAKNALIFPCLGWAAYLKDWHGPSEGERPSAYIVVLGDKRLRESFGIDPGIAAQTMLLGATERGLGGCMIASVNKRELSQALNLPEHLEILLVIALGKPKEIVVIEPVGADGNIKYWRDEKGTHHVPKRSLDEIIVG
jgi:nitroreductase